MKNFPTLLTALSRAGLVFALLAFANVAQAQTLPVDSYQRIVDAYLEGKWDDLEGLLASSNRELMAIPPAKQPEITYIRQVFAECRPAWWKFCKAGGNFAFAPAVWGRPVKATFDPQGKSSIAYNITGNQVSWALNWPTADMDNPDIAEHGFSKGDLTNLSVWSTVGMTEAWSAMQIRNQASLAGDAKMLLQQYLDFRGNVTGVYYGTPRARRWGFWLYMAMYADIYAKLPTRVSREAVAVMFMSEVVSHPAKYPSIKLPATLPAEGAEEKLAAELRGWIEGHGWTIAEDRSLREATALFAAANTKQVNQTGKVTLANGLVVALDQVKDKPLRQKRDAWFKARIDAAPKTQ